MMSFSRWVRISRNCGKAGLDFGLFSSESVCSCSED
jgi:hypothetical protein